ncbi:MAG: hypothetical protein AAFZ99_05210 [Pseudomonadota bacterium]
MAEAFKGTVTVAQSDDDITITLDGQNGNVTLGGNGADGDMTLRDTSGNNRIVMDGQGGSLKLYNAAGELLVSLGVNGNMVLGGTGSDGDMAIRDASERTRINMDADNQRFEVRSTSNNRVVELGPNGNLVLGGTGQDGDLILRDNTNKDTITMNGQEGNVTLGGNGKDGDIWLKDGDGNNAIHLDGNQANLFMGGNGRDGDIVLFAASENNPAEDAAKSTIHLNGDRGDIILRNADCAEEFTVATAQDSRPGDVMVLGDDGLLHPCTQAHDSRVVGVISGADLYKPGIVLDRQPEVPDRHPIALVGKVCVRVTDENGPIRVGDLLTTSSTPGHAMRASKDARAFGAVIGKAFASHDAGTGMIPIVIALQ